jgi:transposase
MSSSTLTPVPHDGGLDASQPRLGGPTRRRSLPPAQSSSTWPPVRRPFPRALVGRTYAPEALCSSQITEWRKLRDAGVLAGKSAGARVGRPSAGQSEVARLCPPLELAQRRLSRTEAV